MTGNSRKTTWEEGPPRDIPNFYTVTAMAWKRDGSRVVLGSLCGSVEVFESVLRRTLWKDKYELTYVGPNQVLVKTQNNNESAVNMIIRSKFGREIDDIRIMGRDNYLVARTEDTLILCDLSRSLISEIHWTNTGRNERFFFDYANVCLIFNAGELSLVEYGENTILGSVRTEFMNPHVISVRLNERTQDVNCKKLAYLLDLKTICIVDLIPQTMIIGQISHDSKIDWLELSETGHKLLFRDKKQRLMLVDVASGHKETIMIAVAFVQWVPGSDVAVAQSETNMAVWYNIDLPEHVSIVPIRGELFDVNREAGKTEALAQDGPTTISYPLDEGLVEFGTAVHDNDFGRAIFFLEELGDKPEAEAMWHNLANIALSINNLKVAERSYAALGDAAKAFYLQETIKIADEYEKEHSVDGMQCPEVWARMAMLAGDLKTAEGIYLEQGDIESALKMYQNLQMWDEVIALAERRNYFGLKDLKQKHMSFLMETGQEVKAGEVYEKRGDLDKALEMYLKSNRPGRASRLVMQHRELLQQNDMIDEINTSLIKNEMFELAGDLALQRKNSIQAIEYYTQGGNFSKALELSRRVSPDMVTNLELQWGDWLVSRRQFDAAINHYIEAGFTVKALDAAIGAKQWRKAIQIAQVVDNIEELQQYSTILSEKLVDLEEYELAEELLVRVGDIKQAVNLLNKAGQWQRGYELASNYLDSEEVSKMYTEQAKEFEEANKLREAEQVLLAINEPDLAIAMYKRLELFEHMIRLVEKYHKDLVGSTHLHLARQLESSGRLRQAEQHFLAAGDWRGAVNAYRAANKWEDAHRTAKQHGGELSANQVAFLWARSLHLESAVRLLNRMNLLDQCIAYACDSDQFDFAISLCKAGNRPAGEVHLKLAMALEDDGKFEQAEAEFILAEKPKEAILMYTHNNDWFNAQRVAKAYDPDSVTEILLLQAMSAFDDKRFAEFEALLIRAEQPELIVKKYRDANMWSDALRVCKEYVPTMVASLQMEYDRYVPSENSPRNENVLLQEEHTDSKSILTKASEFARGGEFRRSIDTLMLLSTPEVDAGTVEAAMLRAADICNQFLQGRDAIEIAIQLGPRLLQLEQYGPAAQLYLGADMPREAVDCFIAANDWGRARRLAKEIDPTMALLSHVDKQQKNQLKVEGRADQLADIDIIGALDLLCEQGQWSRCIEKARQQSPELLHKYLALYAVHLLHHSSEGDGEPGGAPAALALYAEHGVPDMEQNYNVYTRIAIQMFSMREEAVGRLWQDLRDMLYDLTDKMRISGEIHNEAFSKFDKLLLIAHYYTLRHACRTVPALSLLGTKLSLALLRYTDIIPADKGYYEAGMDLRAAGRESEAFVLLNHYLDLCESIEEGEGLSVDHSDLTATDWPSSIPLPTQLHLASEIALHDEVREWILAVSMDQKVDQVLPLDSRDLYESTLTASDSACVISGYPVIGKQPVTFQRSSKLANRDIWSKITVASKMAPYSKVPSVIKFIEKWCGPANYLM